MQITDVLPRDAIPSIDDPEFGPGYDGSEADDVVVVDGEPPRGYPIRILNYHEIVNDMVDGQPVAVTWCPICGSAVVYDATIDGQQLTFGVSGKLADDDLVLYDRETESEWKQSTGRCIAGELEGKLLTPLAAPMVSVASFRESSPDGVLLQPQDDGSTAGPDYDSAPYEDYFSGEGFGIGPMRGSGTSREWDRDDLDPKTVVLGLQQEGEVLAFPRPRIEAAGGLVAATVGETKVVVVATDDGIHAFEHPGFTLTLNDGRLVGDDAVWTPATAASDDGRRLTRLPARRLFAFAWQDDHGPDAFYQAKSC